MYIANGAGDSFKEFPCPKVGLQNAPYLNFKRTSAKYFWKHNRHVLWRPRLYSHVWTKVVHEVLNPVSWGRLLWWPTDGRRWSDLPGGYLVQISRFVYKLNKNNQIDFDSKSIWTSNFEVYSVYRSNFVFHFECHLSTKNSAVLPIFPKFSSERTYFKLTFLFKTIYLSVFPLLEQFHLI